MKEIFAIQRRNSRNFAFHYFFEQFIHAFSPKWRIQCTHFVNHAAQRPYITLCIVRIVFPNFRTCIVRCSSLSVQKFLFSHFRYIQISKLSVLLSILVKQKNVRTFKISMQNIQSMQWVQPFSNLNHNFPNVSFLKELLTLFKLSDFLKEISAITILHDNAQINIILYKRFFVRYYIWMTYWSENSDFIQCIFFFFHR